MTGRTSKQGVLRHAGRRPTFADTKAVLRIFLELDRDVRGLHPQPTSFYRDQVHAIQEELGIPDYNGWYEKSSVDRIVDHFMEHHYSNNHRPHNQESQSREKPKEKRNQAPKEQKRHKESTLADLVDDASPLEPQKDASPQSELPLAFDHSPAPKPMPRLPRKAIPPSAVAVDPVYHFPMYQRDSRRVVVLSDLFAAMRTLDRKQGWNVLTTKRHGSYLAAFFDERPEEVTVYHAEISPEHATAFLRQYLHRREKDIAEVQAERLRLNAATQERNLLRAILRKRKEDTPLDDLEQRIVDDQQKERVYRIVLSVDPASYTTKDMTMPVLQGHEIHVRWYYTPSTLEPVQHIARAVRHSLPQKESSRAIASYVEHLYNARDIQRSTGISGYLTPEELFNFLTQLSHPSSESKRKEIIARLKPMMGNGTPERRKRQEDPIEQFQKTHGARDFVAYSEIADVMLGIDLRSGRSMSSQQYYRRVLEDARQASILSNDRLTVYQGGHVAVHDAVRFLEKYRARLTRKKEGQEGKG